MTDKKGTQEALIDVFGEAMAYNIATDILHCLNKRGYCIWQTYTRQDIRENTNKKRVTADDMAKFQDRLQSFDSIRD